MESKILEAVAAHREDMVRFTEKLVAIPTENPPGNFYRDCVEAVGTELVSLGLAYRIREVSLGGAETTLPRFWLEGTYGEGEKTLYFHGHYDVIPAQSEGQFEPYSKEGTLYGRGTADMKGGLAAMVYAVKALRDAGARLDGRVGLLIVPDEETGGRLGSEYLARSGVLGKAGIGMLTPEPTDGIVWNASRGAVSLRVKIKGRPAHTGIHYRGINAFEQMLKVAASLGALKREVESRKTSFRIEPQQARSSILMMGGQVEARGSFNVVPAACSFTIDRRINPEENLEEEKRRILDLLEDHRRGGIDIEVELLQEGVSAGVSEDGPLGRALAQSIEDVTGKPAPFQMCPGLLEIRFYTEKGIPAFAYGPGLLAASHGPEEFIRLEDLYTTASVYALTAYRVLRA